MFDEEEEEEGDQASVAEKLNWAIQIRKEDLSGVELLGSVLLPT